MTDAAQSGNSEDGLMCPFEHDDSTPAAIRDACLYCNPTHETCTCCGGWGIVKVSA